MNIFVRRPVAAAVVTSISRLAAVAPLPRPPTTPFLAISPTGAIQGRFEFQVQSEPHSHSQFRTMATERPKYAHLPLDSEAAKAEAAHILATEPELPELPEPVQSTEEPELPEPVQSTEENKPALPPLTPHEFRQYNRLAEHMDHFHNHFRRIWTTLYTACESRKRPGNMTLRQFLDEGLSLVSFLTTHHDIEETYFFPMLARRMPEFRQGTRNEQAAELLLQHRQIHAGMDGMEAYLHDCRAGAAELQLPELKARMDTWGDVLWKHLDQEVAALGAENMRRYWSLDEMRRLPI